MGRVAGLVAGVAACMAVSACSTMPTWFPGSAPATATIQLQSDPPGADAKTSLGPNCQTPCSLELATDAEFSVTFALAGFTPQTIPVHLRPPDSGLSRFDPNPVYAQLEPVTPPKKKKPVKKPKASPAAAQPAPPASAD